MLEKQIHHYFYLLNLTQFSRKVPIHLQVKVSRLIDKLEQNEIISLLNRKEQPKGNTLENFILNILFYIKENH